MRNLFLDTNIIIDVLAGRQPYSDAASKILKILFNIIPQYPIRRLQGL
jgi:predicted nucleic acid-binding protein